MRFEATPLAGAVVIEIEPAIDERGFFARTWCARELAAHGIDMQIRQCNVSVNRARHTLRGMHYQADEHAEAKIVSCVRGSLYDVIIDLRPASPTYTRHFGLELNDDNRRMLYIPPGFAHGFETLADHTEVYYQMSAFYEPSAARGVRWDDPAFGIRWPAPPQVISSRDRGYPDFRGMAR